MRGQSELLDVKLAEAVRGFEAMLAGYEGTMHYGLEITVD